MIKLENFIITPDKEIVTTETPKPVKQRVVGVSKSLTPPRKWREKY